MPKKPLDMNKVAQLLNDGSTALRKMASERDGYKEKCSGLEEEKQALLRRMDAEKVAAEMHSKGIRTEIAFDDLAEYLEKEAEAGKLDTIKEALTMTGPDMLREASVREDSSAGGGVSELEQFINGEVG